MIHFHYKFLTLFEGKFHYLREILLIEVITYGEESNQFLKRDGEVE